MLVTDRRRLSPGATEIQAAGAVVDLVEAAAGAGIDLIQIRERDLETRALVSLVRRCVSAVTGTKTRVLVNDRLDVALAADAAGAHLREDSIAVKAARSILSEAVVGRSVHSVDGAGNEWRHLDYLVLGTLFPSASKAPSQPLTSIETLSAICRAHPIPVLAIGGMTIEHARAVARAGAAGIAAIGLFIPPRGESPRSHLQRVSADLRRAFDTCGAVP
jgi:thiamine-phosphate diphosphorylase